MNNDATKLRSAADELNQRIEIFESWLNSYPGKVRAEVEMKTAGHGVRMLSFERRGKSWALVVTDQAVAGHTLLRDSSLDTKLEALELFQSLVSRMRTMREELVFRIEMSVANFDGFAQSIGINVAATQKGRSE